MPTQRLQMTLISYASNCDHSACDFNLHIIYAFSVADGKCWEWTAAFKRLCVRNASQHGVKCILHCVWLAPEVACISNPNSNTFHTNWQECIWLMRKLSLGTRNTEQYPPIGVHYQMFIHEQYRRLIFSMSMLPNTSIHMHCSVEVCRLPHTTTYPWCPQSRSPTQGIGFKIFGTNQSKVITWSVVYSANAMIVSCALTVKVDIPHPIIPSRNGIMV